jgi:hypothetical protein
MSRSPWPTSLGVFLIDKGASLLDSPIFNGESPLHRQLAILVQLVASS